MTAATAILQHLTRPDVSEIAMQGGRLPCAKIQGAYKPIGRAALSNDEIIALLSEAGGERHVSTLGAQPTRWNTRLAGVGTISIAAVLRASSLQVVCTLIDRERQRDSSDKKAASANKSSLRPKGASGRPKMASLRPKESLRPQSARDARELKDSTKTSLRAAQKSKRPTRPPATLQSLELDTTPYSLRRMPAVTAPARTLSGKPRRMSKQPQDWESGRMLEFDEPDVATSAPPKRSRTKPPQSQPELALTPIAPRMPPQESPNLARGDATIGRLSPRSTASRSDRAKDRDEAVSSSSPGLRLRPLRDSALGLERRARLEPVDTATSAAHVVDIPPAATANEDAALKTLLTMARAANASDLHLVADRPPLLRVATELSPHGDILSAAAVERLLLPRVPHRLLSTLHDDGSCDFLLSFPGCGRFRANVSRQRTGYKGSLRLIPDTVPTFESLGLPAQIGSATEHHQGLIVVTGPSGHGKTATLAAIVDLINRETHHHVITVEDPVEYLHPKKSALISQREVGTHTKTFAAALKASLREDPEVIVVGELRDTETVRMALSASETGHLVVSTMNTPNAAKTIDRLIDLFPPGDQQQVRLTLAGGLRLIVSQRLLPNIDRTGVVPAVELLPGSIALWNLIRENKTYQIPSLQQRGKALGIIRMDDSLADAVRLGKTTLEAAAAYASDPDELERVLKTKDVNVATGDAGRAPDPARGTGLLGKAGALFAKKGG